MKMVLSAMLLLAASAGQAGIQPSAPSKHIAKIMAKNDGASQMTAFKVSSVDDEYAILRALGLKPSSQQLVILKKPYDVIEAIDDSGQARKLWFDISSFYPEF